MISSVGKEKSFDKIQHLSMIKTLSKWYRRNISQHNQVHLLYKLTYIVRIIFNSERLKALKAFALRSGIRQGAYSHHSCLTQHWKS